MPTASGLPTQQAGVAGQSSDQAWLGKNRQLLSTILPFLSGFSKAYSSFLEIAISEFALKATLNK